MTAGFRTGNRFRVLPAGNVREMAGSELRLHCRLVTPHSTSLSKCTTSFASPSCRRRRGRRPLTPYSESGRVASVTFRRPSVPPHGRLAQLTDVRRLTDAGAADRSAPSGSGSRLLTIPTIGTGDRPDPIAGPGYGRMAGGTTCGAGRPSSVDPAGAALLARRGYVPRPAPRPAGEHPGRDLTAPAAGGASGARRVRLAAAAMPGLALRAARPQIREPTCACGQGPFQRQRAPQPGLPAVS